LTLPSWSVTTRPPERGSPLGSLVAATSTAEPGLYVSWEGLAAGGGVQPNAPSAMALEIRATRTCVRLDMASRYSNRDAAREPRAAPLLARRMRQPRMTVVAGRGGHPYAPPRL
jgi:hypothetical protein